MKKLVVCLPTTFCTPLFRSSTYGAAHYNQIMLDTSFPCHFAFAARDCDWPLGLPGILTTLSENLAEQIFDLQIICAMPHNQNK